MKSTTATKNRKTLSDEIWNKIAQKRDRKNTRYISHHKAWKIK